MVAGTWAFNDGVIRQISSRFKMHILIIKWIFGNRKIIIFWGVVIISVKLSIYAMVGACQPALKQNSILTSVVGRDNSANSVN